MPKKPTTTREAMIEGAFRMIREKGHEALTARNLAAFLGCSTQPVMYQFPVLENLWDEVYRKADAFHTAYIMEGADLLEIGMRYIMFAEEEPELFRFLFRSGRFEGVSIGDMIRAPEAAGVLEEAGNEAELSGDDAVKFFEPLFALVHGYACLIADNALQYDRDTIRDSLVMIAEALERK